MKCKETNYINRKHKTNINIQIYIAMWAHFLQSKCDATTNVPLSRAISL